MICRSDDGSPERSLPLEDVASVIITSFSATIHSHLLLQAAQHGVSFLFCENFKPASILLPANRCTDTLLTRAVIGMDPKTRHALWQKTIDAKVKNQLTLARRIAPADKRLVELERMASGKNPAREAACAKYYWAILSSALRLDRFTQERHGGGLNHLLKAKRHIKQPESSADLPPPVLESRQSSNHSWIRCRVISAPPIWEHSR